MTHNINMHALAQLVPVGSRVLDLGCGDGALLDHLQKHRGCSGYGVELADTNVQACVQRGVNVLQLNLDQGLTLFGDAAIQTSLHQWYFFDVGFFHHSFFPIGNGGVWSKGDKLLFGI